MTSKHKNAYFRPCNICGNPIIMIEVDDDNWQPFELNNDGRHEHDADVSKKIYNVRDIPTPLTYPTKCRFCQKNIFFHTNGNGDFVLFDRLGLPWEIHGCWKELRNEPPGFLNLSNISKYANTFNFAWAEYSKGYYELKQNLIEGPSEQNSVIGYIAHNPYNIKKNGLIDSDYSASMQWSRLDVFDKEQNIFPFLIPNSLAVILEDYLIVSINGDWIKRPEGHFLKSTRIEILQYEYNDKTKKDKVIRKTAEATQPYGDLVLGNESKNDISQEKFLRLKT